MPVSVGLVATPEASASSLFGLFDTLMAAGRDWEFLVSGATADPVFDVKVVGPSLEPFQCGSGMRIAPDVTFGAEPHFEIVIVPGLTLSPHERISPDNHPGLAWIKSLDPAKTRTTSACTGAVYLAEAGLLNGVEATTHWAWEDLFVREYPGVRLRTDRGLCFADADKGAVTSGGTTGWQELALFLIAHYGDTQRAARAAKIWLMADRGELQAPYTSMIRSMPHDDTAIQVAQGWIADNYGMENPVKAMVQQAGLPPTTFARRFKRATGKSPQDYVLAVRIEEARQLLETTTAPVAEIGEEVGYVDTPSFRRVFKRKTGISPAEHRKMFGQARFQRYS
ncbi:MAG: helix-turn-helix domain-containing protein [Boseongicola sp.]|nr:MAG: helix-turn-helix domain-containing protein [Boseongicola sp.]